MVSHIQSIQYTVTNTEAEALILENNLIKELMPRYNVIFRDDKSYPYLMMTSHAFPMLKFHRGVQKKGNKYFGPFPNSNAVRESIQLLQKVFLLRNCDDSTFNNRVRPCLQHQIKRCTAPCVKLVDEKSYAEDCRQAELFLLGKDNEVVEQMTEHMNIAAENEEYERAAVFRDRIQSLRQVRLKQFVSDFSENDADIIALAEDSGMVCIILVMIRGGRHLGDKTFFPKNASDFESNFTEIFLCQHYDEQTPPPVIVTEGTFERTSSPRSSATTTSRGAGGSERDEKEGHEAVERDRTRGEGSRGCRGLSVEDGFVERQVKRLKKRKEFASSSHV